MWKFRWPALAFAWVVSVVGAIVVWNVPDRFEATARIYVDADSILKPLMVGMAVQPNVEEKLGALSRTLISRPNLERLVRTAQLDSRLSSGAELNALIDRLQKDFSIRTAGKLNIYEMSFRDTDPERARRIVDTMVSMFVESGTSARRTDTDSAKAFLSEQIAVFEAKLQEAESRLKEFRLRNLDRAGADGKDAAARLSELNAQLEAARLQLREAEQARDAARRQLSEARVPASAAPVTTPEIDARIEAQRRSLDGLLQRYTEQHPDVVSTRRLIAELEAQKRREVEELRRRAPVAPPSSSQNESLVIQEMGKALAAAEVQAATMRARVDEYTSRVAEARAQMRTAPQLEAEAAQLNRDYEVTKKNYEDLVARRLKAGLSGELEQATGVADFRVIDPPRVAPKPVFPNRLALFPLALVGGLAAGLLLAYALSQLRPTFADAAGMRDKTGLPVLGVVTALVSDLDRRRARSGVIRFIGASGALVGVFALGMVLLVLMDHTVGVTG